MNDLIKVVKAGDLEKVKCLAESGANIHSEDDDALRWAAYDGHLSVVKYLIELGANIYAKDNGALRWAANNGHLSIVKYLIESGADIHANDDWPLRYATRNNNLLVVEYLILNKANFKILTVDQLSKLNLTNLIDDLLLIDIDYAISLYSYTKADHWVAKKIVEQRESFRITHFRDIKFRF